MLAGAPSEAPRERRSPMSAALKGLRRRITTTKSGEPRMKKTLGAVSSKLGKGLRRAPGAGIKLAKNLGRRLKNKPR